MRHLLVLVFAASVLALVGPKLRIGLVGPLLTTNVWGGQIRYQVNEVGSGKILGTLYCVYCGNDSVPYFEGEFVPEADATGHADLVQKCDNLRTDLLRDGFPPRELAPGVIGPLVLGRLI